MPFKFVDVEILYKKDPELNREDIQRLAEWAKKQQHLPEINEVQLILFYHSCYYRIEPTKLALDSYFTVKTICPDIFDAADMKLMEEVFAVGAMNILPAKTPEGYAVMVMKLTDTRPEVYNFTGAVRAINMICELYGHQIGFEPGGLVIFDMKGGTLGHLARVNWMVAKKSLYHLQEGAPVRLKGIHVINVVPFIDRVISIVKPFIKPELFELIHFHSKTIDSLYEYIPKEMLPKDYGGEGPSCAEMNDVCLDNMRENYDFFAWHDAQKVDESRRLQKTHNVGNIFGMDGTFKTLDID